MNRAFRRLLYPLFFWLWLAPSVSGQGLPTATPEEVGLSSERLSRIGRVMQEAVKQSRVAGVVTAVARRGKVAYLESFGMMDIEAKKPMRTDTIVRLASTTKPITCVAVMMLYEEGRFLLEDPVSKYIPEFKNPQVLVPAPSEASTSASYTIVPRLRRGDNDSPPVNPYLGYHLPFAGAQTPRRDLQEGGHLRRFDPDRRHHWRQDENPGRIAAPFPSG